MTLPKKDQLRKPIELVRQSLNEDTHGREPDWFDHVSQSLDALIRAMREHVCAAEGPNGALATIGSPEQETVATLDRKVQELRQEHVDLLDDAGELHLFLEGKQNRMIAHVSDAHDEMDIPLIRELAEQILEHLEEHEETETKLLVEVYSRDVGVGD